MDGEIQVNELESLNGWTFNSASRLWVIKRTVFGGVMAVTAKGDRNIYRFYTWANLAQTADIGPPLR